MYIYLYFLFVCVTKYQVVYHVLSTHWLTFAEGIDHFAGNATQAVSSLASLVKSSESFLSEVKDRVWVFLGATAGMRMLQ